MKTRIFILLSFIAIAFSSCNLDGESNFTPRIDVFSSHYRQTDTLAVYLTDEGGVQRLDTISVGDTIVLGIYLNGVTNNLTNFQLNRSDTSVSKILLPIEASMDTIFSKSESNYSTGHFIFLPNTHVVYFPIRYIALKPTKTEYIQFALASDANFKNGFGYNTTSLKLKIPAIEIEDSTTVN